MKVTTETDEYFALVEEHWWAISKLYEEWEDKKPVMLFDVQEKRIYAYPYEDFKRDLLESSQAVLTKQYKRALRTMKMVVFVRDNEKKRLMSYIVPRE